MAGAGGRSGSALGVWWNEPSAFSRLLSRVTGSATSTVRLSRSVHAWDNCADCIVRELETEGPGRFRVVAIKKIDFLCEPSAYRVPFALTTADDRRSRRRRPCGYKRAGFSCS